ncbi:hypothetical protein FRC17_009193 [Serendipita sp. 399]|nr:hypothetical protein FRC17_009193 [Serendipita sp. 399]
MGAEEQAQGLKAMIVVIFVKLFIHMDTTDCLKKADDLVQGYDTFKSEGWEAVVVFKTSTLGRWEQNSRSLD